MRINIFSSKARILLIVVLLAELFLLFAVDEGTLRSMAGINDNSGFDIDKLKKIMESGNTSDIKSLGLDKGLRVNLNLEGINPSIYRDLIAFYVSEENDKKDYNADLDKTDMIIAFYNITSKMKNITKIAGFNPSLFADTVAFQSFYKDVSLNPKLLDSDASSWDDVPSVILYYNITEGKTHNTEIYGRYPNLVDTRIAFVTPERWAEEDLNDDGDMDDNIIQYYDIDTRKKTNTGIEGNLVVQYKDILYFQTSEEFLGNDTDGDGKLEGLINAKYNITSEEMLPIYSPIPYRYFNFFVYNFNESLVGTDYNLDGDTTDPIVLYYDTLNNYGFVVDSGILPSVDSFRIVYNVYEAYAGKDLNMDGDKEDFMIYAYPLVQIWPYQLKELNISLAGHVYMSKADLK